MSTAPSSSSSPLLASVASSLKVWSWDTTESSRAEIKAHYTGTGDHFHCLAWNHSNQVVAVGGREAKIDLVQVSNGALITSLPLSESLLSSGNSNSSSSSSSSIRSLAFAHNSKYLATSIGSPIQLWDLKKKQIKSLFMGHRSSITGLSFNSKGDVYAVDEAGVIKLWSFKSPEASMQDLIDPSMTAHSSISTQAHCMQLSLSGTGLAVGYGDGTLRIWDSTTGSMIRKQRCHSTKLTGLSWSPRNPRLISTVGMDEKLYLINTADAQTIVSEVVDVGERLTCVSHHENGFNVAVGTVEGNIYLYDWRKAAAAIGKIDGHGPHPVNALSYQMPRIIKTEVTSETSTRTSRSSMDEDSTRKSSSVAPATSIISLNNKPPTPPTNDKVSGSSRSSTPSRMSTSTLTNSALANAPIVDYKANLPLENKDVFSHPVPTTEKVGLNGKNNNSLFGTAHNNPEILQKVNSMITDYERSIRPLAVLESPRASQAPSRNRYAPSVETSLEELPAPGIVRHEKSQTKSEESPKQMDPIQFRSEILKIEQEVKGTSDPRLTSQKSPEIKTSSIPPEVSIPRPEPPKQTASFSSKYSARAKEISEVGGYEVASQPIVEERASAPHSSSQRDYMRDEDDLVDSSRSPLKDDFSTLRQAVRPITARELDDSLELLKYDIHREVQEIIREQVRQFSIAKEDTVQIIRELSIQLKELLIANKELRDENERLRKIY